MRQFSLYILIMWTESVVKLAKAMQLLLPLYVSIVCFENDELELPNVNAYVGRALSLYVHLVFPNDTLFKSCYYSQRSQCWICKFEAYLLNGDEANTDLGSPRLSRTSPRLVLPILRIPESSVQSQGKDRNHSYHAFCGPPMASCGRRTCHADTKCH